jgi:hypothetical protein
MVLTRGPAWTNTTSRSLALARYFGFQTNASAITNGPAANVGVYVGTIATDPAAATVSFNPYPSAASGGPSGGAWLGLWNYYNRVELVVFARDSATSWTYNSATWREADNSANNRVTTLQGLAEDVATMQYQCVVGSANSSNYGGIGVGLDSATSPSATAYVAPETSGSSTATVTISASLLSSPLLGQHYAQALESSTVGTTTYQSASQMQVSARVKF